MIFCLYVFFISLFLFFLLIDFKKIHMNIYGGIIAAVFKVIFSLAEGYSRFRKNNVVIESFPGSIFFSENINIFIPGIAFTMGILFLQLLPDNNLYLQLLHAIAWSVFYILLNVMFMKTNVLAFIYSKPYIASHPFLFFLCLAWFKTNFLSCNKRLFA